ncbi:arabinan endo-1,5-alpha-L-arabinosidase [Haloferula luteola]|uniref:Arabinan endo-1,5-alpha-L-arabinosidase n=1 Tax=Haloferula luteola TaxID=595692 RepID=A0A840V814_9BACT|nr:arabinan endo-1,5-alpha-L-arabinosidase [Haloferula luteola]MBB5349909.1 arabinan endo-1,5-alpha-L-arabinosidase [Haloferula luteola]
MMKCAFLMGVLSLNGVQAQNSWQRVPRVHDPSTVVRERGDAWCFTTGNGIGVLKQDGKEWSFAGTVFPQDEMPAWHRELVPGNEGHLWAPDVIESKHGWWLYYSVSTFGKNQSAIGLASRRHLGAGTDEEPWKDEGVVITSGSGDRFNAIDPAVIETGNELWMSFGSFWDGIQLVELDRETGLRKHPDRPSYSLANAPEIEAPFIHEESGWYYLFVNWGKCCRGVDSTYEIRVGRSKKITGPYLDQDGTPMTQGGGSLVLGTRGRYIGPGHASILEKSRRQWLVHHYYDGEDRGRSKLRLLPLVWKEGWPVVEDA